MPVPEYSVDRTIGESSSPLQFFLLGAPQILLRGASVVPLFSRKAQGLLYYLATMPNLHHRPRIASLFWPDVPDSQSRKNLRNILPEIRKHLPAFIKISSDMIGFEEHNWPAVDVFSLVNAFRDPTVTNNPAKLLEASMLYKGDFLEGFSVVHAPFFEDWLIAHREQYHLLVVDGLYQAAQRLLEGHEIGLGIRVTRRILEIERWHEPAHRLLMQFLALDGQRAAALEHYQKMRSILFTELGVEPDPVTESLRDELDSFTYPATTALSRLQSDTPFSAHVKRARHNLLQLPTSFMGREEDADVICKMVTNSATHLLALVGEDGMGKTRLVQAVAKRMIESNLTVSKNRDFPDGIWYVPLKLFGQSARAAEVEIQLSIAIAKAMHYQYVGSRPIFAQLITYMRHKAALLILDDIDELLPPITDCINEILHVSPQTVVIVTTRSIPGEFSGHSWKVSGLGLPALEMLDGLNPAACLNYAGIALFVDRAQHIEPNLHLNHENSKEIVQICHLVGGSPFSIELLAAQVRQLSCAHIHRRLRQIIERLPSSAESEISELQRVVSAVITFAWQQLTLTEQEALMGCMVFNGDFTADALVAVTQLPARIISSLEEKAFLQCQNERYSLHKLVRQFVAAQPLARETADDLMPGFSNYFLNLFINQRLVSRNESQAQESVFYELDNIQQAWQWAANHHDFLQIERALPVYLDFYRKTGFLEELTSGLDAVIAAVRNRALQIAGAPNPHDSLLGRVLVEQAYFYVLLGREEQAVQLAQEGISIGERLNLAEIVASGYCNLSLLAEQQGDILLAHRRAKVALEWAVSAHLTLLEIRCQNIVGRTLVNMDDAAGSLPYFERSLALARSRDSFWEAQTLGDISLAYLSLGEFALAQQSIEQSRILSKKSNLIGAIAWTYLLEGERTLRLGQLQSAQQSFEEALSIYSNIGQWLHECIVRQRLSRLFAYRKDHLSALRNAEEAIKIALEHNIHLWLAVAYVSYGHALVALERLDEAKVVFQKSKDAAQRIHNHNEIRVAELALANVSLLQNAVEEAIQRVETCLPLPKTLTQPLNGDPAFVWLVCYRVLSARNDPRATLILRQAEVWLTAQAAKIREQLLQRAFWENVPTHSALRSLFRPSVARSFQVQR